MADASAFEPGRPFASASELRLAHTALLEELDGLLEKDPTVAGEMNACASLAPQVREFLERGVATGVFLEETKDRTACQILLDYWTSSLARAGVPASGYRLASFSGEQLPDLKDKKCPYEGLDAFRNETFFFGREADTQLLLAQIRATPLVVVLGASGSGKSSLVMAGALPALTAEQAPPRWRIAPPVIPGDAMFDRLAEALASIVEDPGCDLVHMSAEMRARPEYLADLLAAPDAPPAVITIDQFEEVFTLGERADREALTAGIAQVLASERGHRVVITVREEFRSRIVELRALEPYLEKSWYSMRPMNYDELRAAVEKPAAMVNLQFQSGIVDDLVKKVLGQPAALPLLQFTLRKLWDERDRNRITWERYNRVGDPLDALKASAENFYLGLAQQTQDEVKRILLALVRVDELLEAYRQPLRKAQLLAAGKANTEDIIELLATNDYIRIASGRQDGDAIVEVKHEALIRNWPRFVGWIDEKRVERRQRIALTQVAQRWANSGKPAAGLLTGWQLEEAKRQTDLAEVEQEFVDASGDAVQREQREKEEALRRDVEQAEARAATDRKLARRATILATVAILILLGVLGATWHFYTYAKELKEKADSLMVRQNDLEGRQKDLVAKTANLVREKEILASANASLHVENVKLLAIQIGNAVAPGAHLQATRPVTIFIHISDEAQRPRAMELAKQLKANQIKVPGIEKVDPVAKSDVRYFRPMDEPGANEIVRLLNKYLGVGAIVTKLIKGYEQKVPQQQYEIWFGNDAFAQIPARPPATAATALTTNTTAGATTSSTAPTSATGTTTTLPPPPPPGVDKQLPATPPPVRIVRETLKKGHGIELPGEFKGKVSVFVGADIAKPAELELLIYETPRRALPNDYAEPGTMRMYLRGEKIKPLLDSPVGPEPFKEKFTFQENKYRIEGRALKHSTIQFAVFRE